MSTGQWAVGRAVAAPVECLKAPKGNKPKKVVKKLKKSVKKAK